MLGPRDGISIPEAKAIDLLFDFLPRLHVAFKNHSISLLEMSLELSIRQEPGVAVFHDQEVAIVATRRAVSSRGEARKGVKIRGLFVPARTNTQTKEPPGVRSRRHPSCLQQSPCGRDNGKALWQTDGGEVTIA